MADVPDFAVTPQERLAISRKAIVRNMQRNGESESRADSEERTQGSPSAFNAEGTKWRAFKRAARAWWHNHPANVALDLAKPVIGDYAKKHPLRVLGIAAGVGAATVVIKPWRLVSLGGIALATMKSSGISGVILSLLTPSSQDSPNHQRNE